jgi:hypothetical protein
LDRLLNGYRIEFYKGPKCKLSEEEGQKLFANQSIDHYKKTDNIVPDECVKYVTGKRCFIKNTRIF